MIPRSQQQHTSGPVSTQSFVVYARHPRRFQKRGSSCSTFGAFRALTRRDGRCESDGKGIRSNPRLRGALLEEGAGGSVYASRLPTRNRHVLLERGLRSPSEIPRQRCAGLRCICAPWKPQTQEGPRTFISAVFLVRGRVLSSNKPHVLMTLFPFCLFPLGIILTKFCGYYSGRYFWF